MTVKTEVSNEQLEYLDLLRKSGVTNMFGTTQYLVNEFSISKIKAREILSYWMKTFSERIGEE